MTDRTVRVYKLDIEYPPGSDAPGWVPAAWPDFLAGIEDKAERRRVRKRGFRWPREHLYLSASGAHSRAWLLRWFGATVYVDASDPVTWPEWQDTSANGRDWEAGSTAMRCGPEDFIEPPEYVDPLDAAARYLYPPDAAMLAELRHASEARTRWLDDRQPGLSAADVRDAMAGIFAEGEWHK